MDRHSLEASIDQNLPALLALTAYWNSTVLKIPTHCLLPYDERLRVLGEASANPVPHGELIFKRQAHHFSRVRISRNHHHWIAFWRPAIRVPRS